jgi:hypothetical protein
MSSAAANGDVANRLRICTAETLRLIAKQPNSARVVTLGLLALEFLQMAYFPVRATVAAQEAGSGSMTALEGISTGLELASDVTSTLTESASVYHALLVMAIVWAALFVTATGFVASRIW